MVRAVAISLICLFLSVQFAVSQGQWRFFEETMISGTISGTVRTGHIFKTVSGNLYEIVEPYIDVVVEVMPEVIILTDGNLYKLIIKGFHDPAICRKLKSEKEPASAPTPSSVDFVESKIDGEFNGYEYGKIYKLINGHIWEQVSARYRYRYRYMPSVMIVRRDQVYMMKVEGMDDWVTVRRLK